MTVSASKTSLSGHITVPGSKSHTIRALILATLAEGVSEIKKNCAKVAKAGLCAEVTEIDVKLGIGEVKKFAPESAAFAKQGERYREIVSAFLSARNAGLDLQAFNWWGLTDAYTWLTDFHSEANFPLLFDRCNKAKPAYTGVMEALR